MYNHAGFNNFLQLLFYAAIINYVIIVMVRTIYRYLKIDKYVYDYYNLEKMSILSKLIINLRETLKKINNLYYLIYLLIAEAILYWL